MYPGAGADDPATRTVYLNSKSAYFPNDLAFTDNDGSTLLKHWFEYDGNNFWVKVADTLESNATIYLYYGNISVLPTPIDAPNTGVWVRPQTTPILAVGAGGKWDDWWAQIHSIWKEGSTYYAYYSGSKNDSIFAIGLATSTDGITWTKDAGADGKIFSPGAAGKWDDYAVSSPLVWKEGATWYMLYGGEGATGGAYSIGLATSSDGISWTRYDVDNPVMTVTGAAWDSFFVLPGTNILKEGSTYYFYYWGGTSATSNGNWQIGLATSTDLHTWTKSGNNPVVVKGAAGDYDQDALEPCVTKIGSTYYMWYQGNAGTGTRSRICLASSATKDADWVKSSLNPVLNNEADAATAGTAGVWDDAWVESPVIVDFGTHWRLYYSGSQGGAAAPRMQTGYTIYTVVGDGPNTFLLFDDFHGLSVNAGLWTNTGTFTQDKDALAKYAANTNTTYIFKSVATFDSAVAIEAKAKVGSDWADEYGWAFALCYDSAWATSGFFAGHTKAAGLDVSRLYEFPDATYGGTTESITTNTWYKLTLKIFHENQYYLVNGTQKGTLAKHPPPTVPQYVLLASGRPNATADYTAYFDWAFVRKCIATEPAISSFGAEEPLAITLSVDGLAHADSLGAVALTQVHNLAVNALNHANAIDGIVLIQDYHLIVEALSHAHSIDAPALTQIHQLTVQAMSHSHALGGVSLSQIHSLLVDNLMHAHGIENVILTLSFLLVVENLIHSHSLGTVNLTQNFFLIVQALQHLHRIEAIRLFQFKKPPSENFRYQTLKLEFPEGLPEGDFAYGKSSLKMPDMEPEGDFRYKKVT